MNFNTTTPKVWLNQPMYHMTENLNTDEWFIFNIQETGTDLNIYILCFCVCVHACTVHRQWTIFEGIL